MFPIHYFSLLYGNLQNEKEDVKIDPGKDASFADEAVDTTRAQKDQVTIYTLRFT